MLLLPGLFAGDGFGLIIAPLIALAFMFFVYFLWKEYEQNVKLA
ncbi:hypothetical protein [Mucilaginibacter arboris]|nr:hypothetical protein [Mucilaginibacter arboris]